MRGVAASGSTLAALALLAALPASATALDPVAPRVPGNGRAWELVTPAEPVAARVVLSNAAGLTDAPAIVSASGDRFEYQARGSLPDASFGGWITRSIASRGTDGWSNESLPYPRPDTLTAFGLGTGYEDLIGLNPELTRSIWTASTAPPDSAGFHFAIFTGTLGGPYLHLLQLDNGLVSGVSPDLSRIFFNSERPLVPEAVTYSLYEYNGGTVKLVNVKADGTAMTCGEFLKLPASDDALFQAKSDCSDPSAPSHVFLRADGHTTDISASQCTLPDCGPEAEVGFLGVSPDGSTVFLVSKQRLTDADNEGAQMVYRYDAGSETLSQLYQQPAGSTATEISQIHSSADGSRAYFSTEGQLLPGEGAESGRNLYLADDEGLHFIAPIWEAEQILVSADGRYAVFASAARLVPADTDESVDVYRYDAEDGSLQLISTGAAGTGNGPFEASLTRVGRVVGGNRRVLFRTAEPLLAQDHNDKDDVYEWTEGGGLSLVSGGVPGLGAELVGSTADGGTVFFRTGATLLPRDRDLGEQDVYAARIGGGFPEPAGEAAPGCCAQAPTGHGPHRPPPSGPGVARRLELAPLDAAARRQLAATGSTVLLAETPAGGKLTATARAAGGRSFLAATGKARASGPGPVRLRLRLTARARKALAHDGRLRLRLVLALAPGGAKRQVDLTLRRVSSRFVPNR